MKTLIFLVTLSAYVLGRVPYNNELGISTAVIFKEITELKALTEELTAKNLPYIPHNNLLTKAGSVSESVYFYVYTNKDSKGKKVAFEDAANIDKVSSFNPNYPTIFLIHGWHNTVLSPINIIIKASVESVGKANIIAVDWDDLSSGLYMQAYTAVPDVGKYLGQFIQTLSQSLNYPFDNIVLIGHSLGAHVAGFAGNEANNQLRAIIGLDPAGPLYLEAFPETRLSPDDAQYVKAIHTNGQFLGVSYSIGNADFWPNGGYSQPGCGLDIVGTCAHSRSYHYYSEAVTGGSFVAKQCANYQDYTSGLCNDNPSSLLGGFPFNFTATGNFYLVTNSNEPFALGEYNPLEANKKQQ